MKIYSQSTPFQFNPLSFLPRASGGAPKTEGLLGNLPHLPPSPPRRGGGQVRSRLLRQDRRPPQAPGQGSMQPAEGLPRQAGISEALSVRRRTRATGPREASALEWRERRHRPAGNRQTSAFERGEHGHRQAGPRETGIGQAFSFGGNERHCPTRPVFHGGRGFHGEALAALPLLLGG